MSKILFAMAHVLTTQGWFQPTQLLPQLDLQPDEAEKLVELQQAAFCEHDSPLAQCVHELAASYKSTEYLAVEPLKHAVKALSAESPVEVPEEAPTRWVDPTPSGQFPTPENYVRSGYLIETYERSKTSFFEEKQDRIDRAKAEEERKLHVAAAEAEAAKQAAEAEAAKQAAEAVKQAELATMNASGLKPVEAENPGSQPPNASESTTT